MDVGHPLLDPKRLAALATYEVMDTLPDFEQDCLTEIAAQISGYPVALISLMDEHRQWFKSNYGLTGMTECPAEVSVCSATVCANDIMYVPDLTLDDRFKDLPIVIGEPNLQSYCGMPLINNDGYVLGTLCIVDFQPHELDVSQREAIRRLAQQSMAMLEMRRNVISLQGKVKELQEAKTISDEERDKSEAYLDNIFPKLIAHELKTKGRVEPKYLDMATVVFADFVDFSQLPDGMEPARLIEQLNLNFARFDQIATENRVVTLRTVGDGYLCAAGLPENNATHAVDACLAALQMQQFVAASNKQRTILRLKPWQQRIGINTGPLVAGIVGTTRLTYDVWGTSVNTAARLEQSCEPDRINISGSTVYQIRDLFEVEPRGHIEIKNLGAIDMFYLNRILPEFSADENGCLPNDIFWQKFNEGRTAMTNSPAAK